MATVKAYLGIDVQKKRGCPYVVLDTDLKPFTFGWLKSPESITDVISDLESDLGDHTEGSFRTHKELGQVVS